MEEIAEATPPLPPVAMAVGLLPEADAVVAPAETTQIDGPYVVEDNVRPNRSANAKERVATKEYGGRTWDLGVEDNPAGE